MYTAFYIVVTLLQFSIGQDSHYELPEEFDTVIPSDNNGEYNIMNYVEPPVTVEFKELIDATDPEIVNEDISDIVEPIAVVYAKPVEETTTSYDAETTAVTDNVEEIKPNEDYEVDEIEPYNIIPISDPVKAKDDVTLIAQLVCEVKDFTSNEEDTVIEPISFGGSAKAQGKVTIAAHFGCGENSGNIVSIPEVGAIVPDEISDEPVTFGGVVQAQGKVVVGSHYGCGTPIGMYQPPFLPWCPTFFHPLNSFHPIPVYPQYPFPVFGGRPFTVPDEYTNEGLPNLPAASNLANSGIGDNGKPFYGVVPAGGTVTIAARF